MDSRVVSAQRASIAIASEVFPVGGVIRSTCGKKSCVNPKHLYLEDPHSEPSRPHVKSTPSELQKRMAKSYASGLTLLEVADKFGTSRYHVRRAIKAAGGSTRASNDPRYLKHDHDRSFFDTIDNMRAYWAGNIAADGHLQSSKGTYAVKFGIHKTDRELLDRLAEEASCSQKVFAGKGRTKDCVFLNVYGKEWVHSLVENFDLHTGKKDAILTPPSKLSEGQLWHFVRGFFDGDGCTDGHNYISFSCNSKEFMEWLKHDFLRVHHKLVRGKGSWTLKIYGPALKRIIPRLYEGSTEETRLDRKYRLCQKLLSACEARPDRDEEAYAQVDSSLPRGFSVDRARELADFYATHSMKETAAYFGCGFVAVRRALLAVGAPVRGRGAAGRMELASV